MTRLLIRNEGSFVLDLTWKEGVMTADSRVWSGKKRLTTADCLERKPLRVCGLGRKRLMTADCYVCGMGRRG